MSWKPDCKGARSLVWVMLKDDTMGLALTGFHKFFVMLPL